MQISILRILIKVQKNFCLNLLAIDLKFAQIVAFYKAYHLLNFQIDSIKIQAWPIKKGRALKNLSHSEGLLQI